MTTRSKKVDVIYQFLLQVINSQRTSIGELLPTEDDLKNRFNISRPTISKALNQLEYEGYVHRKQGVGTFVVRKPHRTEEKKSIGLLFPLFGRGEIFEVITQELINVSEKYNFNMIWGGQFSHSSPISQQMNQMIDFYLSSDVKGIIMAPVELSKECHDINKNTIKKIKEKNIPLILVDADYMVFPQKSEFDLIGIDNFRVGYLLAQHFIKQGAARVDYCSYMYSAQTVLMRIKGYQQALLDADIVPSCDWIHNGDPRELDFVEALLAKQGTNFICSNDTMAFNLIKTLEELDYSVPSQIRVTGVDDLDFARYSPVPLTTVRQPCKEIALTAIEALLSRIDNPLLASRNILLNSELIIRSSSKL